MWLKSSEVPGVEPGWDLKPDIGYNLHTQFSVVEVILHTVPGVWRWLRCKVLFLSITENHSYTVYRDSADGVGARALCYRPVKAVTTLYLTKNYTGVENNVKLFEKS